MRQAAGVKGKCDRLFSLLVRAVGVCANEACTKGNPGPYRCMCPQRPQRHTSDCRLQCAHVVTRSRVRTRCDLRNAVALCAACHHWFTLHPVEWGRWVDAHIPDYDEVMRDSIATGGQRFDWDNQFELLQGLAKQRGVL
jgi:hypothetical protein